VLIEKSYEPDAERLIAASGDAFINKSNNKLLSLAV